MGKMLSVGAVLEQCRFPSPGYNLLDISSPCTASCPVPRLLPWGAVSSLLVVSPTRLCPNGQSTPPAVRDAHLSLGLTQASDLGPPLPGSQHQTPAYQNAWRQGSPQDSRDCHRMAETTTGWQGPLQDISGNHEWSMARAVQASQEEQQEERYRQRVLMASVLGLSSAEVPLLPVALQRGTSPQHRVTVQRMQPFPCHPIAAGKWGCRMHMVPWLPSLTWVQQRSQRDLGSSLLSSSVACQPQIADNRQRAETSNELG